MKELEELYHEILVLAPRFADSLLEVFHNLIKVTVYSKSTVDKYIGESIVDASDFIKVAQRIVIPLRKVMDETTS